MNPSLLIYQWVLLAFAAWTLTLMVFGIGILRWQRILAGRARLTDFPGDTPHGSPGYRRLVRAHANCIENLPVYTAIVVCATWRAVDSTAMDVCAMILIAARILQSAIHIARQETSITVALRFSCFMAQLVAMVAMGIEIVRA
jgi:uncharacterized MAPEG superfamily protein